LEHGATLESDPRVVAAEYPEGQGFSLCPFAFINAFGTPKSDKLI
jgi:hypothetical protein